MELTKTDKLKLSTLDRELEKKVYNKTMEALLQLILQKKTSEEFIRGVDFALTLRRSLVHDYPSISNPKESA